MESKSMEKTIIEGNKIIVEFEGWTIEPGMENEVNPFYNQPPKPGTIPQMVLLSEMRYHSSWDWLMPVVEKIEAECFASFSIGYYGTIVRCNNQTTDEIARFGKPKIQMTWLCVIAYLSWLEEHPFAKPSSSQGVKPAK